MARATISSLNAQRSSIDPPPRPTMMTSTPGSRPMARRAAGDLEGRAVALHPRRANDEMRVRVAAAEHVDDVANRRAVERRDDADLAGQRRQRPLARGVEQAFLLQPLLELIEGELQRAEPVRLHVLAHELILALRLVHRDASARHDAQAVGRLEFQIAQRGTEDDAPHLRAGVLQREVEMPGVPHPAVRELAFHPDFEEFGFEQIANPDRQLGDAEHPSASRRAATSRSSSAVGRSSADGAGRLAVDCRPRPSTGRRPAVDCRLLTTGCRLAVDCRLSTVDCRRRRPRTEGRRGQT